ncbi:hypothetical protein [Glycomyces buryatensis]|uniref:Glycosyltransferase RgtA/B/C/D-like domain-containing protein n=1 Tax=Glycomyces buryatensis TaxID=2570927 RepID=A0A4S8PZH0_9ACTN|nr:hypothetical protein [Glycomyces buryatensis]THV33659.1 hypothetical protein FAB82_26355 [Glycomyces buryatensis]
MIRRRTVATALILSAWALLLVLAWALGQYKVATTEAWLKLSAMPLYGHWHPDIDARLLIPIGAGALLIAALPVIAARWRWRWTVAPMALGGIAFSLALSFAHSHENTRTDLHRDYGAHIHLIDDAGGLRSFLETYTTTQAAGDFPTHLSSHPPGLLTLLWGADRIGLSGLCFDNTLILLAAGASVGAALIIGREIAGERLARRAAPFLVIVPAAFWHNNADIVFCVVLVAMALLVLATGRTGPKAWALTVAGGLLAGAAALLTFSSALVALPFLVVAVLRRRWDVILGGGAVAAAIVLAPLAWGYWYLDGMAATRIRYYAGVASHRGYWYFLIGNPAILALAIGPAITAALVFLRNRAMWIVVGSALASIAIATFSGMYSGEVERIWQPFIPLILLAGCALRSIRPWLTVQLGVAVLLAAVLQTPW